MASRVAGLASAARVSARKSSSVVVTMFSISELAWASSSAREWMKTWGLGSAERLSSNPASSARAAMRARSTSCGTCSWSKVSTSTPRANARTVSRSR